MSAARICALESAKYTNGLAPNFFSAMELPLVRGRAFSGGDEPAAPRVAVVNQAFVRANFAAMIPLAARSSLDGLRLATGST